MAVTMEADLSSSKKDGGTVTSCSKWCLLIGSLIESVCNFLVKREISHTTLFVAC